ncbi:MAG: SDR family oxidoreductase [Rhodospirillales bacterium]|nr:SDR family oxidoreductase [Rhodospirillales bacterium]
MDAFQELRGKRVLITGASSGIGAAAAQAFVECGATVTLHYSANREGAERLVEHLSRSGGTVFALQADLGQSGAGTTLTEAAIRAMGGIDILINNAGAALARIPLDQFDPAMAERIVQLNQHAVAEAIAVALPHFRHQRHGVVINTTSIAARNGGGFGVPFYASAKGAVEALTRSLARDEARYGIRVNCVEPGYIDTPIHQTTPSEQIQRYLDATPLGRAGMADDCVGVFLFLACERLSAYVTGQTIAVNGGMHMI